MKKLRKVSFFLSNKMSCTILHVWKTIIEISWNKEFLNFEKYKEMTKKKFADHKSAGTTFYDWTFCNFLMKIETSQNEIKIKTIREVSKIEQNIA